MIVNSVCDCRLQGVKIVDETERFWLTPSLCQEFNFFSLLKKIFSTTNSYDSFPLTVYTLRTKSVLDVGTVIELLLWDNLHVQERAIIEYMKNGIIAIKALRILMGTVAVLHSPLR